MSPSSNIEGRLAYAVQVLMPFGDSGSHKMIEMIRLGVPHVALSDGVDGVVHQATKLQVPRQPNLLQFDMLISQAIAILCSKSIYTYLSES